MRGEVQGAQEAESSLQAKVEPVSVEVKEKMAAVSVVEAGGEAVIEVLGAVVSGVRPCECVLGALTLAGEVVIEVCGATVSDEVSLRSCVLEAALTPTAREIAVRLRLRWADRFDMRSLSWLACGTWGTSPVVSANAPDPPIAINDRTTVTTPTISRGVGLRRAINGFFGPSMFRQVVPAGVEGEERQLPQTDVLVRS